MSKLIFKIDAISIKDSAYAALPFGRKLEYQHAFTAFKNSAQSIHFSAKHTTTAKAFREFVKLYQPKQYFLVNRDGLNYHDDSFQVWFTK